MQPICTYPVAAEHVMPYIGSRVCAVTLDGECYYGTIDRVENGNLYLRPFGDGMAGIRSVEKFRTSALRHPAVAAALNQGKSKMKGTIPGKVRRAEASSSFPEKAKINAFFPWLIFPLFWLAALFTFPFWW